MVTEQQQLLSQNEVEQRQTESLRSERERLEARAAEIEHEIQRGRLRIAEVDDALRTARQHLDELRDERRRFEVERARNDSEREHLRASCLEELNAQPEDLIAEQPALLGGEELATADTQYRELKELELRVHGSGKHAGASRNSTSASSAAPSSAASARTCCNRSPTHSRPLPSSTRSHGKNSEEAFVQINAHFTLPPSRLSSAAAPQQMRLSEPDSAGDRRHRHRRATAGQAFTERPAPFWRRESLDCTWLCSSPSSATSQVPSASWTGVDAPLR